MTDFLKKLPKTITKEIFIHVDTEAYHGPKFYCTDYDASDGMQCYVLLGTQEVTFKIPQNIDIKGEVIKGLENDKEKIQADTHMKLKDIQDKIDNLLAIEHLT